MKLFFLFFLGGHLAILTERGAKPKRLSGSQEIPDLVVEAPRCENDYTMQPPMEVRIRQGHKNPMGTKPGETLSKSLG